MVLKSVHRSNKIPGQMQLIKLKVDCIKNNHNQFSVLLKLWSWNHVYYKNIQPKSFLMLLLFSWGIIITVCDPCFHEILLKARGQNRKYRVVNFKMRLTFSTMCYFYIFKLAESVFWVIDVYTSCVVYVTSIPTQVIIFIFKNTFCSCFKPGWRPLQVPSTCYLLKGKARESLIHVSYFRQIPWKHQ